MEPKETMKEYLDEQDLAKMEARDKMKELLETRYGCYCQRTEHGYFVITANGCDGGDLRSNGTYEYDFHKKISFRTHTKEQIIEVLDEYFEI